MADPILLERNGDITVITLNRPEAGNRQTDTTWAQATVMIDTASKESRLILFRGAGEDFCLGREAMGQPQPTPVPEAYAVRDRSETIFNLYGAFRNSRAPIIGVVQTRHRPRLCARSALRYNDCERESALSVSRDGAPHHADHRVLCTGRPPVAQSRNLHDLLDPGNRRA